MATSKPKIDYTYNSKKETAAQYNARIAKARGDTTPAAAPKTTTKPTETVTQTMAKSKAMLAQTKAEGGKAFAGSAYDKPISSTTLTPVSPVTLTQPQQPLQTTGMLGEFQQASDTYNQNLQNKQAIALSQKDTAATAYKDFLGQLQGQTGLEDTAYSQKGGVDSVQKELDDINNQILQEQRSLQNKLDKLEQNAQGMLSGALDDQMYDVERESLKKQADLSIIQMGIQGRYDSAKSVADRAVSAYLEKQRIIGETLKFNYEENKDAFTLAEQRAFESAQKDRDRALAKEESDRTAIYNMAIQAQQDGAPLSTVNRILSAKTLDGAIGVGWTKPVSGDGAPKVVDINGVSSIWNPTTGKYEAVSLGGDGNVTPADAKETGTINDIDKILLLTDDQLQESLGKRNIIQRNIPGTTEYQFAVQHDNLMNQLALAARGDLKGQGAVSDYEAKLLKSAQTTLNLYMDPKAYRDEAKQVKGAIQTSSGIPAYVEVKSADGKETRYAVLSSAQIQDAVNQGYVIKYQ